MTDRRFGKFKFGSGTLFGPSDDNGALAWDCSFDWDRNGTFDQNEAEYLKGYQLRRGRSVLLQESGGGFEPIQTGTLTLTFDNSTGRFDAWNPDSPLFPTLGVGVECRLRVRPMNGATVYKRFRGHITKIEPAGFGAEAVTQITVSDGLNYLRNRQAGFALATDITPDQAIVRLLDGARWRWGRNIQSSVETIPYTWAASDVSAMSNAEDYANSYLGYFFCNANNDVVFYPRSYVSGLVAEFSQTEVGKEIGNAQPSDISRNVTRINVHPRQQSTLVTLWSLVGEPYEVQTGAANARKVFCTYSYNSQGVPGISPVITDFEANTASDFTGTDLTAQCATTLENIGDKALVTLTNNSASVVHMRWNIEGYAIYETYVADVTYPRNPDTVTDPRELYLDLKWMQDPNVARDIADVMGAFFAGLHPMPSVRMENRFDKQFTVDLFDIVSADLPKLGLIGESFRVGGIEERSLSENLQGVETTLFLEPYIAAGNFMQWDTNSVFDTSTVFGW